MPVANCHTVEKKPRTTRKKSVAPAPIIKRSVSREIGVFIDGISLDRAARRERRRVDFQALLNGVCEGLKPSIVKYYTVIPYEDDSRHRSYLDAVKDAGYEIIVKRLPPKGIDRQVSTDVEMTTDLIAFAHRGFSAPDSTNSLRAIVVCPSRDLSYPFQYLHTHKVDTVSFDFGKFLGANVLKSANKWVDLSDTQSIWLQE